MNIPEQTLLALRAATEEFDVATVAIGEAHMRELEARVLHQHALIRVRSAEEHVLHVRSQYEKMKGALISMLNVEDGTWEIDLEAGKLVKTDG